MKALYCFKFNVLSTDSGMRNGKERVAITCLDIPENNYVLSSNINKTSLRT